MSGQGFKAGNRLAKRQTPKLSNKGKKQRRAADKATRQAAVIPPPPTNVSDVQFDNALDYQHFVNLAQMQAIEEQRKLPPRAAKEKPLDPTDPDEAIDVDIFEPVNIHQAKRMTIAYIWAEFFKYDPDFDNVIPQIAKMMPGFDNLAKASRESLRRSIRIVLENIQYFEKEQTLYTGQTKYGGGRVASIDLNSSERRLFVILLNWVIVSERVK